MPQFEPENMPRRDGLAELEQQAYSFSEDFYARSIGREVLTWAKSCAPHLLGQQIAVDALLLLKQIQSILNDDTYDDPECFYRIDAIVTAFHEAGLSTDRHWELE